MAFNINAAVVLSGPKNIQKVRSSIQKQLSNITVPVKVKLDKSATAGLAGIDKKLSNLNTNLSRLNTTAKSTSRQLTTLASAGKQVSATSTKIGSATSKINKNLKDTANQSKAAASSIRDFGVESAKAIRKFSAFTIATTAVFGFIRSVQQATSEAIRFERELVKITQVTGAAGKQLSGLKNTIDDISTGLGLDANKLLEVSRIFAQTGQSLDQVQKSLKAVSRASLAPTFGDIERTTEGLIAALNQFNISANKSEAILGSLNAVAKKFAVESDDLISVIRRAGGVFAASSQQLGAPEERLRELIGIFTAVRSTTRESADSIATGLRTIFTRIQRPQTIKFLQQFGIQLRATAEDAKRLGIVEGEFIGIFEALKRISQGTRGLDTLSLAKVVEELGGIRQVGKLIPALQNFEKAEKARRVALEGTASISKDVALATQTLSVQIEKLQQRFGKLVRDVSQSATFQSLAKFAISAANAFITLGESLKPIIPLLTAFAGIKIARGAFEFGKGFVGGLKGVGAAGAGKGVSGVLTGQGGAAATAATANQKQLISSITKNTTALSQNTSALSKLDSSIGTLRQSTSSLNSSSGQLIKESGRLISSISQLSQRITSIPLGGGARPIRKFKDGGFVSGPSHAQGGVVAELEGGEFVVPKKDVRQGFPAGGKVYKRQKFATGSQALSARGTITKRFESFILRERSLTKKDFEKLNSDQKQSLIDKFEGKGKAAAAIGANTGRKRDILATASPTTTSQLGALIISQTGSGKLLSTGQVVDNNNARIFLSQAAGIASDPKDTYKLKGSGGGFPVFNLKSKSDVSSDVSLNDEFKRAANIGLESAIKSIYDSDLVESNTLPPIDFKDKSGFNIDDEFKEQRPAFEGAILEGFTRAIANIKAPPDGSAFDLQDLQQAQKERLQEVLDPEFGAASAIKGLEAKRSLAAANSGKNKFANKVPRVGFVTPTYTFEKSFTKNKPKQKQTAASGGRIGLNIGGEADSKKVDVAISDGEGVVPASFANKNLNLLDRANKGFGSAIDEVAKRAPLEKVVGLGTGTSDSIKTTLNDGDFVIRASSMDSLESRQNGTETFAASGGRITSGGLKMRGGGVASAAFSAVKSDPTTALLLGFQGSLLASSKSAEEFNANLQSTIFSLLFLGPQLKDFSDSIREGINASKAAKDKASTGVQSFVSGPTSNLRRVEQISKGGDLSNLRSVASPEDFDSATTKILQKSNKELADAQRTLVNAQNNEARATRALVKAKYNEFKQTQTFEKAKTDLQTSEKTLAKRLKADSALQSKLSNARAKQTALENAIKKSSSKKLAIEARGNKLAGTALKVEDKLNRIQSQEIAARGKLTDLKASKKSLLADQARTGSPGTGRTRRGLSLKDINREIAKTESQLKGFSGQTERYTKTLASINQESATIPKQLAKNADELATVQKAQAKATATVNKLTAKAVDSKTGVRTARTAVGSAEARLVDSGISLTRTRATSSSRQLAKNKAARIASNARGAVEPALQRSAAGREAVKNIQKESARAAQEQAKSAKLRSGRLSAREGLTRAQRFERVREIRAKGFARRSPSGVKNPFAKGASGFKGFNVGKFGFQAGARAGGSGVAGVASKAGNIALKGLGGPAGITALLASLLGDPIVNAITKGLVGAKEEIQGGIKGFRKDQGGARTAAISGGAKGAISGAATGASIGLLIAPLLGPAGPLAVALGALGGALVGAAKGVADALVEQAKFDALSKLNLNSEKLSSTLDKLDGAGIQTISTLKEVSNASKNLNDTFFKTVSELNNLTGSGRFAAAGADPASAFVGTGFDLVGNAVFGGTETESTIFGQAQAITDNIAALGNSFGTLGAIATNIASLANPLLALQNISKASDILSGKGVLETLSGETAVQRQTARAGFSQTQASAQNVQVSLAGISDETIKKAEEQSIRLTQALLNGLSDEQALKIIGDDVDSFDDLSEALKNAGVESEVFKQQLDTLTNLRATKAIGELKKVSDSYNAQISAATELGRTDLARELKVFSGSVALAGAKFVEGVQKGDTEGGEASARAEFIKSLKSQQREDIDPSASFEKLFGEGQKGIDAYFEAVKAAEEGSKEAQKKIKAFASSIQGADEDASAAEASLIKSTAQLNNLIGSVEDSGVSSELAAKKQQIYSKILALSAAKVDALSLALNKFSSGVAAAVGEFSITLSNVQSSIAGITSIQQDIAPVQRGNIFKNVSGASLTDLESGIARIQSSLGNLDADDLAKTIKVGEDIGPAIKETINSLRTTDSITPEKFEEELLSNLDTSGASDVAKKQIQEFVERVFSGNRQDEQLGLPKIQELLQQGGLDDLIKISGEASSALANVTEGLNTLESGILQAANLLVAASREITDAQLKSLDRREQIEDRFSKFTVGGPDPLQQAIQRTRSQVDTALAQGGGPNIAAVGGPQGLLDRRKNLEDQIKALNDSIGQTLQADSTDQSELLSDTTRQNSDRLAELTSQLEGTKKAIDILSNDTRVLASIENKLTSVQEQRLTQRQRTQAALSRLDSAKTPEERNEALKEIFKPLIAAQKVLNNQSITPGEAAALSQDLANKQGLTATAFRQQEAQRLGIAPEEVSEQSVNEFLERAAAKLQEGAAIFFRGVAGGAGDSLTGGITGAGATVAGTTGIEQSLLSKQKQILDAQTKLIEESGKRNAELIRNREVLLQQSLAQTTEKVKESVAEFNTLRDTIQSLTEKQQELTQKLREADAAQEVSQAKKEKEEADAVVARQKKFGDVDPDKKDEALKRQEEANKNLEKAEKRLQAVENMANNATQKGSIYTHDVTLEKTLIGFEQIMQKGNSKIEGILQKSITASKLDKNVDLFAPNPDSRDVGSTGFETAAISVLQDIQGVAPGVTTLLENVVDDPEGLEKRLQRDKSRLKKENQTSFADIISDETVSSGVRKKLSEARERGKVARDREQKGLDIGNFAGSALAAVSPVTLIKPIADLIKPITELPETIVKVLDPRSATDKVRRDFNQGLELDRSESIGRQAEKIRQKNDRVLAKAELEKDPGFKEKSIEERNEAIDEAANKRTKARKQKLQQQTDAFERSRSSGGAVTPFELIGAGGSELAGAFAGAFVSSEEKERTKKLQEQAKKREQQKAKERSKILLLDKFKQSGTVGRSETSQELASIDADIVLEQREIRKKFDDALLKEVNKRRSESAPKGIFGLLGSLGEGILGDDINIGLPVGIEERFAPQELDVIQEVKDRALRGENTTTTRDLKSKGGAFNKVRKGLPVFADDIKENIEKIKELKAKREELIKEQNRNRQNKELFGDEFDGPANPLLEDKPRPLPTKEEDVRVAPNSGGFALVQDSSGRKYIETEEKDRRRVDDFQKTQQSLQGFESNREKGRQESEASQKAFNEAINRSKKLDEDILFGLPVRLAEIERSGPSTEFLKQQGQRDLEKIENDKKTGLRSELETPVVPSFTGGPTRLRQKIAAAGNVKGARQRVDSRGNLVDLAEGEKTTEEKRNEFRSREAAKKESLRPRTRSEIENIKAAGARKTEDQIVNSKGEIVDRPVVPPVPAGPISSDYARLRILDDMKYLPPPPLTPSAPLRPLDQRDDIDYKRPSLPKVPDPLQNLPAPMSLGPGRVGLPNGSDPLQKLPAPMSLGPGQVGLPKLDFVEKLPAPMADNVRLPEAVRQAAQMTINAATVTLNAQNVNFGNNAAPNQSPIQQLNTQPANANATNMQASMAAMTTFGDKFAQTVQQLNNTTIKIEATNIGPIDVNVNGVEILNTAKTAFMQEFIPVLTQEIANAIQSSANSIDGPTSVGGTNGTMIA